MKYTVGVMLAQQAMAVAEVVLKDFDGTKTIYPAKMPLPEMISNTATGEGIPVTRRYAKTDQRDEQDGLYTLSVIRRSSLRWRVHRQSESELLLNDGASGSFLRSDPIPDSRPDRERETR